MPVQPESTCFPAAALSARPDRPFYPLTVALLSAWMIASTALAASQSPAREAHRQMFQAQAGGNDGIAAAMTVYEGARTCARCHEETPAEVAGGLHYQLTAPARNVLGAETNLMGMGTDYCAVPATVSSINWLGLLQPGNTNLPPQPAGCAQCHVGTGAKPNPVGQLTQQDLDGIDCLICHAPDYSRVVIKTNGQFKLVPAPGVNMILAVQNVQRPTSEMCLRCHSSSGGGLNYKRGDMPSALTDVHAAAGLHCVDCHSSQRHHIAGAGDLKAVDLPGTKVDCTQCHTAAPHQGANAIYNAHTDRIACQTCHIPSVARGEPTLLERDWTEPVLNTGTGLYGPRNVLGTNVAPVYAWWNGQVQAHPPGPVGTITDVTARIYPWKPVRTHVPADATNASRLLPLKTGVYNVQGNVNQAVAAGATETGTPYSGKWTRVTEEARFSVQHQVAPASQALKCQDCHTATGGKLDLSGLGYTGEQLAFLQSTAPWKGTSHVGRLGSAYQGPGSCTQCHAGKAEEVMDSIHYTWRTPNTNVAYPGGGSHGMIDRFCGLVGANAMVNYFGDVEGSQSVNACGKCHIGQSLPLPNFWTGQYSQKQKDELDCLICHAASGQYDMNGDGQCTDQDAEATSRTLLSDPATGRRSWYQDRSLRAAESVGPAVGVAACLRCHEHGQAAANYKRGTPYKPEHDVHAAAGLNCTSCHKVAEHKMARGRHVSDLHGWERPEVAVDCVNCHSRRPHPEWPDNPAFVPYNEHAAYISCQACHIPWVSGVSQRAWVGIQGATNGTAIPEQDQATGLYEPSSQYTAPYRTRPVYRWFNGAASMLAEPIHDANAWDSRVATRATPGAMIYPFRQVVNGMVLDRRGLAGDAGFDSRFTMAGAMDASATPLIKMGFMRPDGLTDREREVLGQYPNLLSFDLETYVQTGDINTAIDIGLGRLGMLMQGRDPYLLSEAALAAVGSNLWSGDFVGLNLPNNPMDPTFDPTAPAKATGSFVSVNHAVDRRGLKCVDCHSRTGVMDFRALSFSEADALRLSTMFEQAQFISMARTPAGLKLRWSTIPGRTYRLEASPALGSGTWTPITTPKRTISRWLEHVIPTASLTNAAFFRVQETP